MSTAPIIQFAAGLAIAVQAPVATADQGLFSHASGRAPVVISDRQSASRTTTTAAGPARHCADLVADIAARLDVLGGTITLEAHIKNRGSAQFDAAADAVIATLYAVSADGRETRISESPMRPSDRHLAGEHIQIAPHDFVEAGSRTIAWQTPASKPYAYLLKVTLAGDDDSRANDCRQGNNVDLLTAQEIESMFEQSERTSKAVAQSTH